MDFLRFTLHLINFLAWPVVALGYPICASIRAIESGSKYHMRKLVIYWTIFSFISLFQHLFDKLIQWVPLWPHIKLITICWLVIPQFNGACYLYQIIIRPCFLLKWDDRICQFNSSSYVYRRLLCLCLSLNLRTVADWFNKPMEDQSLKNESFLAVVERYLEENGSDALEKLIANKYTDCSSNHHAEEIKLTDTSDEAGRLTPNQTECKGSCPGWEAITVMEHIAKHEAAEPKQVRSVEENLIQIEKERTGVQVKEMVVPADDEDIKFPEVTSSKKVQTEQTCAVCELVATSEQNLKSRVNRRKRKKTYEGLKTCKQISNSDGSSPVTTKSNQLNLEQVKHAAAAQSEHCANEAAEPKKVKSVKENPIQIEKRTTGEQIKETAFPADAKEIKLTETNSVKKVQKEWTCAVCQVTTNSEHDLKCHLLGRRHRGKCEELNTCKRTAKTERNPPFASNMPDKLKQKQVKHTLAAHKSKLWCCLCDTRCPDENAMAAHLNGRKHLAKLQERMSFTSE